MPKRRGQNGHHPESKGQDTEGTARHAESGHHRGRRHSHASRRSRSRSRSRSASRTHRPKPTCASVSAKLCCGVRHGDHHIRKYWIHQSAKVFTVFYALSSAFLVDDNIITQVKNELLLFRIIIGVSLVSPAIMIRLNKHALDHHTNPLIELGEHEFSLYSLAAFLFAIKDKGQAPDLMQAAIIFAATTALSIGINMHPALGLWGKPILHTMPPAGRTRTLEHGRSSGRASCCRMGWAFASEWGSLTVSPLVIAAVMYFLLMLTSTSIKAPMVRVIAYSDAGLNLGRSACELYNARHRDRVKRENAPTYVYSRLVTSFSAFQVNFAQVLFFLAVAWVVTPGTDTYSPVDLDIEQAWLAATTPTPTNSSAMLGNVTNTAAPLPANDQWIMLGVALAMYVGAAWAATGGMRDIWRHYPYLIKLGAEDVYMLPKEVTRLIRDARAENTEGFDEAAAARLVAQGGSQCCQRKR